MKTYTGTVVYSIHHEVTVTVADDASRKDIESAMLKYFEEHDLKNKPNDFYVDVFDIEDYFENK